MKELDYLIRPRKYVKEMRNLLKSLVDSRTSLQNAVDEASNSFGHEIKPDVLAWLKSAADIISEADHLESPKGRCARYRTNRGAVEISEKIRQLPPAPSSSSVALPPPLPALVSDPNLLELGSNQAAMKQVMEALQDESCNTIVVFGMGGVGKTTLVKKVAEKVKQEKQFNQVVMGVVSQSPDVKKIQGQMASMLKLELDHEADESGRARQLLGRIKNVDHILVILDDVWEHLDFSSIGIPRGVDHKGCKVIVTTRKKDYYACFSSGVEEVRRVELLVLSEEESWRLFKSNAGWEFIETSASLKKVAREVMEECQGLPIALVTLGRALYGKSVREWENAKLQLRNSVAASIEGVSKNVISCLRLSYDYLGNEDTKACFLICCSFPEDADIEIETIVRYAVGKGLFQDAADTVDAARGLVNAALEKLKAYCLLLEGSKNGYVRVHDVVRDVGIVIASETGQQLVCKTGPGAGGWLQFSAHHGTNIMYIRTVEDVTISGELSSRIPQILTLDTQGVITIDKGFWETSNKELRVLSLSASRVSVNSRGVASAAAGECSINLKTMIIESNGPLDNMSALGELNQLEILSFHENTGRFNILLGLYPRFTMTSLPEDFRKLTGLRLLDLTGCHRLKTIPANVISQMCRLEELYMVGSFCDWEIQKSGKSASLAELESLSCLNILAVEVRYYTLIPHKLCLPKLAKFYIAVGDRDQIILPGIPYANAKSRCLILRDGRFHIAGIQSLLHLADNNGVVDDDNYSPTKLPISSTANRKKRCILTELLPGGGGLNNLQRLEILVSTWIKSLTNTATTTKVVFANLEFLVVNGATEMTDLGVGGGVLPDGSLQNLRYLDIEYCSGLEGSAIPSSWVHRLHNLEEVKIGYCWNVKKIFNVREMPPAGDQSATATGPVVLSNLKKLELRDLPELIRVWSGESAVINLSNLITVDIVGCGNLDSVFPADACQSLVNLESLRVEGCSNLKTIVEIGDNAGREKDDKTFRWPRLKTVTLIRLKKFRRMIGAMNYGVDLPLLQRMVIRDCPRIEMQINPV